MKLDGHSKRSVNPLPKPYVIFTDFCHSSSQGRSQRNMVCGICNCTGQNAGIPMLIFLFVG
jgi:hypothetical protein